MQIRQASILRENWMLKAFVFIAAITVGTSAGYLYSVWTTPHPQIVSSPHSEPQRTEEANDSIKQTVQSLQRIKTDAMDNNIPDAARPLLTRLKHQLRDLVFDTINERRDQSPNPTRLQTSVLNKLKIDGILVEEPAEGIEDDYLENGYAYGSINNITIQRVVNHPDLLAATTTIELCCGSDTSLYIFKNDGTQWNLVLAHEANEYADVSGAHGALKYAISPTDDKGEFFVVVANVNPWCTSNWQSLRYAVLRLSDNSYQPKIIMQDKDTIFLDDDPPYKLKVNQKSFSLTFDGDASKIDDVTRKHLVTYVINGERATRSSKILSRHDS